MSTSATTVSKRVGFRDSRKRYRDGMTSAEFRRLFEQRADEFLRSRGMKPDRFGDYHFRYGKKARAA